MGMRHRDVKHTTLRTVHYTGQHRNTYWGFDCLSPCTAYCILHTAYCVLRVLRVLRIPITAASSHVPFLDVGEVVAERLHLARLPDIIRVEASRLVGPQHLCVTVRLGLCARIASRGGRLAVVDHRLALGPRLRHSLVSGTDGSMVTKWHSSIQVVYKGEVEVRRQRRRGNVNVRMWLRHFSI